MRASPLVLVAALVMAGCGSDSAATPDSASQTTTAGTLAASDSSAAAATDVQHLTFTSEDGTAIDYVLLVPPGRAIGQPGKVLFTFPPGGQDLDVTTRIVEDRWREEALARDWVVASPAAPETGLFYDDKSAVLVPEVLDKIAADYRERRSCCPR